MNLKFYKIRSGAKLPVRAHPTDAGMDMFYCPNGDKIGKLYETKDYGLWFLDSIKHFNFDNFEIGVVPDGLGLKNIKSTLHMRRNLFEKMI